MYRIFKKFTVSLLILTLLCCSLSGCQTPKAPEPHATEPSTTAATEPPTEAPTEAPTEPAENLSISTSGGVVLVGTVNQDTEGWFLTPETVLDVVFSYFPDEPMSFHDVTRIYLFHPSEDGVDKSLYLGQTVTIEGTFTLYRDYFDRLYLLPYRIFSGKVAEQSYAAPELQPPDAPQDLYDPSIPLPEAMQTTLEDGHYVFNMYKLSQQTLSLMGNDFAEFFVDLVDAVVNYQPQCPCPDPNYAQLLSTITFYEFPLFNACTEPFQYHLQYDPEEGMIQLQYKYEEAQHRQLVERFQASANELLADVTPGDSQPNQAMAVYHALCTRMTYDYSALEDLQRKDPYYAYLDHTGVCVTFAIAYNQLLNQIGIHTELITGPQIDGVEHAWSLVTIDGKQYFCDPTYELNYLDGTAYRYFCTNYAERIKNGLAENSMFVGMYNSHPLDPAVVSETALQLA